MRHRATLESEWKTETARARAAIPRNAMSASEKAAANVGEREGGGDTITRLGQAG
jgi:hypothetical protein